MDPVAVKRAQRELYDAGEYYALSNVLAPAASILVDRTAVAAARDEVMRRFAGGGVINAEYLLVMGRAR